MDHLPRNRDFLPPPALLVPVRNYPLPPDPLRPPPEHIPDNADKSDSNITFMKGPKRKRLAKVGSFPLRDSHPMSVNNPHPKACDACHKSKRRCDGTGTSTSIFVPFPAFLTTTVAPCSNWYALTDFALSATLTPSPPTPAISHPKNAPTPMRQGNPSLLPDHGQRARLIPAQEPILIQMAHCQIHHQHSETCCHRTETPLPYRTPMTTG